ncbi:MAG: hypothetical protein EOO90_09345 [Pedobacter sp.]|nr:MAG: hypothetical protein EOO90_09345 [Pedobacter sp.]
MGKEKQKNKKTVIKKEEEETKYDFNDLDLGDADDSSGSLGMDNFKLKDEENWPNRGRIDDL